MTDKTQELEQTINTLKVRVFDLSEALQVKTQESELFKSGLANIANIIGLHSESTTIQQVVDAVASLLPAATEAEVVDE
ncbi:tail fiber chaperone [Erwinia phage Cronus]|uniref:Tail fiber assembly protein n=1 Tax=Erwinia phage Cronus TaxID=2163633 RepID=A0A2S1GMK3_9CAUD|nr:tail fiber chaperone [Erwinia phage Cronus]AWD90583.1 hypothetical protein [Erwinia phage Cronus]